MKIYVINVPSAQERRAFQEAQATRFGLDMHFVTAVDASGFDDAFCQRAANKWTRAINKKDIACFMSHRQVWSQAAQDDGPVMVIEDDIVFSPDILSVLAQLEARQDPWDVIYDLEYVPGAHGLSSKAKWTATNPDLAAHLIYKNKNGLGAYALSPKAAKKLHDAEKTYAMADAYVWTRPWLSPYQIEPAPCIQMLYLDAHKNLESGAPQNRETMFKNTSYLRRKLKRLKITIDEARRYVGGVNDIERRGLKPSHNFGTSVSGYTAE